uniref:hypothetical protein n=1 Tax=Caldicellulosiruptor sp. F32 TaxID=1214564 RepID=UPI0005847720
SGRINIVMNTPTKGRQPQRDGFLIRRFAVENKVPIFTSVDTAKAAVEIIEFIKQKKELDIFNIGEIDNEAIRR